MLQFKPWTLLAGAALTMMMACSSQAAETDETPAASAEIVRYPIPGSDFPISNAVEVPASKTLVFLSGKTPQPANPDAEKYSSEFWGDTEVQTVSALSRIEETLKSMDLELGDIVKMQAFLVGDPAKDDALDFAGFMAGYTQFFGTEAQPKLPARSALKVAGLAAPGMLVEIDVIAVRP